MSTALTPASGFTSAGFIAKHLGKVIAVLNHAAALPQAKTTEQQVRIGLDIATVVASGTATQLDDDLVELVTAAIDSPEVRSAFSKVKAHLTQAWHNAA